MTEDSFEWKENTFEIYHNDETLFVNKVLKFFFDKISEEDIYKNQSKKINNIYKRGGKYYCLKRDREFDCSSTDKQFQNFIKYYSSEKKLKHLYGQLNLVCIEKKNQPLISDESESDDKYKYKGKSKSSSSKSRSNSKSEEKSRSNSSEEINNTVSSSTASNLIGNITHPNEMNIISKDNRKDSHNVTNNTTYVFNNLFKSDLKYTMENLVYELKTGEVYYAKAEPDFFIKKLQNSDNTYTILTMMGEIIQNETGLSMFGYKTDRTEPQNLYDFINLNKQHFMTKNGAYKFSEEKFRYDKETEWVDNVIEKFWHKCIYGPKKMYEGIKGTEILNVLKLKNYIENSDDKNLYTEFIRILGYKNINGFTKSLESFINARSKKYEFRYKSNNSPKKGRSHKEPLLFKKMT